MARMGFTREQKKRTYSVIVCSALSALVIGNQSAIAAPAKNKTIKNVAVKNAKRSNPTSVVNTLLNGIGAPSASVGINGDFYIDTVAMNIYGPKKKNSWPLPKSLVGPQGVAGVPGKQGSNGKDGRDGTNGKGGERGPAGSSSTSAGVVGPAGPAGPTGPAGPAGPTGPTGAQGAAGSSGAQGAQGPSGAAGAAGVAGAQGIQGIQGAVGATGPARIVHGSTLTLTLNTATPGGGITSAPVVTVQSNKKYFFNIRQFGSISSAQKTKSFGMEVAVSNVSDLNYSVIVSEAYSYYRVNGSVHEYVFEAVGTFSTSSNPGDLSFSIYDASGTTGAAPMTLTGNYFVMETNDVTNIAQTNPVTAIT